MSTGLHLQGFEEAFSDTSGLPPAELVRSFGLTEELLDTPALFAADIEERLLEYYRARIAPVLRAAGRRGEELRDYLHDPRAYEDASKVGAVALLTAILVGEEPVSTANVVAFALALMGAVSRTESK